MIKRIVLVLISLMVCSAALFAQNPTDRWPYYYDSFGYGVIRMTDGTLLEGVSLNICIGDASLHYVGEDGKILAAKMMTVFSARIGNDIWLRVGAKMMKVLKEADDAAVLELYAVDSDKLSGTEIGYGITSKTASSQKLTSYAFTSAGIVNTNIRDAISGKSGGEELPIKQEKYLRAGKSIVKAGKRYVLALDNIDKNAAIAFFKENKIKWNKDESLLKVSEFLLQYE